MKIDENVSPVRSFFDSWIRIFWYFKTQYIGQAKWVIFNGPYSTCAICAIVTSPMYLTLL